VAAIVARTDGVPLFVEEMTKAMVEAGASQSHAPLPERAVPATLHASLMARLDRLGTAAKEMAQIGAVIGREFPYELLAAVAPGGGNALAAPLKQLVEAGLISQRGTPPDAMYLFKHALVQDAAYGTLLRDHRRNLHARIARVLHSGFPESAETVPEILARHFTEAGDVAPAIGFWYKAGEKSTRQSANREAIAQLKTGLRLVDQVPDADERHDWELRLLVALGPALMATMSSAEPEVTQTYARARQLAQQKARSAELFQALWGSWLAAFSSGDLRGAGTLVEELFAIAQAEGSAELTFQAHHAAWPTLLSQGNLHGAQQSLDAGLPLYRRDAYRHHALMYGGHDPGVCGRGLSGMNLALLGRLDRALGDARETLALAQGLDHRPTLAHGYWLAAEAHYLRRDVAAVRELADAMLALAVEHGTALAAANAKMFRGWALAASGSVAEGIASAQAGLAAWQATGSKFHGPYRLARVADALILGDRIDDALTVLAAASAMATQTGEHWFDAEVARLAAMARLRSTGADRQQAEQHLRHAVASAHACGAQLIELRAATSLAALLHDQGRRGEAFDLLLPVHGRFSEGFDTPDLIAAQALIDQLR
jgi:predicted ATPase